MTRIVVVGGGASGVLLAVHLLRGETGPLEVVLVERRAELGAGIAYATNHPDHLLNVRAANMSAFPDDPGHFVRWLADRPTADAACGADGFAPRRLYRDYLADLIDPLLRSGRLRRVEAEATGVKTVPDGVEIACSDGSVVGGDAVVVATGNEGPSLPPEPWRHEGWGDPGPCRVPNDAAVVVVGTGLTMVDRVLWLLHDGHRGPITAISRHGLLPQAHGPGTPLPLSAEDVPFGAKLTQFMAWIRARAAAAEQEGLGWRNAFDGLRPHTQALWAYLPESERRQFLRHAKPLWDLHRHRIAPQASLRLAEARARGQFRVLAGRVQTFTPRPDGSVAVDVTLRGGTGTETLAAAAVFECRGRAADVTRSENPLLRDLLVRGTARPDTLGLGLAVSVDCALLDDRGRASERIYAMGPVTSGTFWEIVAIPDIRKQAQSLATTLRDHAALLTTAAQSDTPSPPAS